MNPNNNENNNLQGTNINNNPIPNQDNNVPILPPTTEATETIDVLIQNPVEAPTQAPEIQTPVPVTEPIQNQIPVTEPIQPQVPATEPVQPQNPIQEPQQNIPEVAPQVQQNVQEPQQNIQGTTSIQTPNPVPPTNMQGPFTDILSNPTPQPQVIPVKKSNKGLLSIILALVLVLGGVGYYLLSGNTDIQLFEKNNTNNNSNNSNNNNNNNDTIDDGTTKNTIEIGDNCKLLDKDADEYSAYAGLEISYDDMKYYFDENYDDDLIIEALKQKSAGVKICYKDIDTSKYNIYNGEDPNKIKEVTSAEIYNLTNNKKINATNKENLLKELGFHTPGKYTEKIKITEISDLTGAGSKNGKDFTIYNLKIQLASGNELYATYDVYEGQQDKFKLLKVGETYKADLEVEEDLFDGLEYVITDFYIK